MILQTAIPYDVAASRPLPGVAPLDPAQWLIVDDAYAGQMTERARLLAERRADVLWLDPRAQAAASELLSLVLGALPEGFLQDERGVLCPDGRRVQPDASDPLGTLGALVQEDVCLLMKEGTEHVLRGALLCFPASWTLREKAGRPLRAIHGPVEPYDEDIARRVQRLFDGVRVGRPLWRFNALSYENPALYQPRSEAAPRLPPAPADAPYLRSERQSVLRLPVTGAVVFSIHTFVLRRDAVSG